jgi:hypothetical protein
VQKPPRAGQAVHQLTIHRAPAVRLRQRRAKDRQTSARQFHQLEITRREDSLVALVLEAKATLKMTRERTAPVPAGDGVSRAARARRPFGVGQCQVKVTDGTRVVSTSSLVSLTEALNAEDPPPPAPSPPLPSSPPPPPKTPPPPPPQTSGAAPRPAPPVLGPPFGPPPDEAVAAPPPAPGAMPAPPGAPGLPAAPPLPPPWKSAL